MRRGAKPGKPKAEARSPVTRKSLKNADSRVRDLEKRLAEALEREKATADALREKDRALTEALEQQAAGEVAFGHQGVGRAVDRRERMRAWHEARLDAL